MMAELLTAWEYVLLTGSIDDYLDMFPCDCEALCTCQEQKDPP